MKKALLLLLASLSAAGAALAHPPAANVNFTSERGVPFAVVLDGRPLTRGLTRQVHLEQLAPGLHYADFSVPTPYGGAARLRSRVWLEPGLETTFVLLARPGRPLDLRPAGAVALYRPAYGAGRYGNRRGSGYGYGYGRDRDNNQDRRRYDQGYPNGAYPANPYDRDQRPAQPNPYDPYDQDNWGGYGPDPRPAPRPYGQPDYDPARQDNAPAGGAQYDFEEATSRYQLLEAPEVDQLAQALSRSPFEQQRLQLAKQALDQRSIRAVDLQQLLTSFQFDDARVELTEFAYPHVADRPNFARVYQSFDFSLRAREVQDAVARM